MLYENALRIRKPQRIRLHLGRVNELRGGQRYCGLALNLEPYRVMQTARGTGASVSQSFNEKVVVLEDFRP